METQNEMILNYIKQNGEITSMDAFRLGVTRLSGRVFDLRRMGYPVMMRRETKKSPSGRYKTYGVYYLKEGDADGGV